MKRRHLISVLLCTVFSATSAMAAERSAAKLCQDIAARLREQSASLSSKPDLRPIQLLSGAPRTLVELASSIEVASISDESGIQSWREMQKRFRRGELGKPPVTESDYAASFNKEFHPDSFLANAVRDGIAFENLEIMGLPGGSIRALTAESGSAGCTDFIFFEIMQDGTSRLSPDPPQSMDGGMEPDMGPHRIECTVSRGYLARVEAKTAFVVADYDPTAFGSDLRLATYEDGSWSRSCRVEINFQTEYKVAKAYVAEGGPLSHNDLVQTAPQIALAMDTATETKSALSFGPPIPSKDKQRVRRAVEAARDGHVQFEDRVHVPEADNWGGLGLPSSGIILDPIVLHGTPYVITIEHPTFGWRDEPGYTLVIYQVGSAKLSMIAAVEISAERGPLKAISVAGDTRN